MKDLLGMNAHVPHDLTLSKISEVGVKWIRCDFDWNKLEPEKGEFNWSRLDPIVEYCETEEINILAVIGYTPSWANEGQSRNYLPTRWEDWIDFVFAVVRRYENVVKHWAIWNEPNVRNFFNGNKKDYGEKILSYASEAIKFINPDLKIIAPSITCNRNNWPEWLNEMAWYAERDYFDITAFQLYRYPGSEVVRAIDRGSRWGRIFPYRQAIKKYIQKIGKPTWITETGWSTNHTGLDYQRDNYETVLEFVNQCTYLDRVFYYEMVDETRSNEKFGILYSNLNHKPTYEYVKSLR